MEARPFADREPQPAAETLRDVLGAAFGWYEDLLAAVPGYVETWNYSKGSGWMLKVHDRKKALLYLIPLRAGFRVAMAIREAERESLLADDGSFGLRTQLASARKAPEGFALTFDVASEADLASVNGLVRRLVELRRA